MIGLAGATETGSIDDLEELAFICQRHSIHFHVDAAWGGPSIFSTSHQDQLAGIQYADSITIDGHKQLYTPMGCGLILFKDPKNSLNIRKTANYIIRSDSLDIGKYTLEGSRPANVIFLHAGLCLLGCKGYEALIDRGCYLALYMKEKIASTRAFEIVASPTINILLYRWVNFLFLLLLLFSFSFFFFLFRFLFSFLFFFFFFFLFFSFFFLSFLSLSLFFGKMKIDSTKVSSKVKS